MTRTEKKIPDIKKTRDYKKKKKEKTLKKKILKFEIWPVVY